MTVEKQAYLYHYFVLFLWLLLHGLAFVWLNHLELIRNLVLLSACMGYVLWGIIHHYLEHDLDWQIVIEYVLLGTLGFILVSYLT